MGKKKSEGLNDKKYGKEEGLNDLAATPAQRSLVVKSEGWNDLTGSVRNGW